MSIFPILAVILVVAILIGFNALYVAGEFATVSARRPRLTQMAEEGSHLAKMLLGVIKNPRRLDNYIAASQVGITISSIVLGIYGQQAVAPRIEPWLSGIAGEAAAGSSAVIVLIFFTTLQVIFGELLPKSVAIQYPERVAQLTALPMRWSAEILLRPLIFLLNGSGRLLLKLLRVPPGGEHTHIHSPEEILLLVQESHKSGLLDADERRMLNSVFRVSETRAAEIIVPRPRIVAAEVNQPLKAILEKSALSAHSRLPIFEKDLDNILGYVHLQDVFKLYRRNPKASVHSVLREAPFIPETVPVTQVWNEMNRANSYLAIVFDEFGGTTGLITREDVIEELFGELQDEFDQEPALVRHLSDGRIVVRGEMSISVLSDLLEADLPHENVFTVAGLIENKLGRIPDVGDQVKVGDFQFQVEAVAGNTVTAVCVVPPENHLEKEDKTPGEEE
jgi:CBS domain containing-hemolysin-like protein